MKLSKDEARTLITAVNQMLDHIMVPSDINQAKNLVAIYELRNKLTQFLHTHYKSDEVTSDTPS